MVTDSERREVARRLRGIKDAREGCGHEMCCDLWRAIFDSDYRCTDLCDECEVAVLNSLADLIDPTFEARRDALFYPATGLTPEYEETVYRCGECGEIVSYDEGYDPETDLPAHCERCGSRITGIGEPWDE